MNRLILKLRNVQLHENTLLGTSYISSISKSVFFIFNQMNETNGALIGLSRNSLQGKSYFGPPHNFSVFLQTADKM